MKRALITGTNSGIGLATSLLLARNGYRVFAGMRNTRKSGALREAAGDLPVQVVEMDIASAESTARAFAEVRDDGPLDVLVNNAGIGGACPLEIAPEDEHRALFETNYFGAIRCIQCALPQMRERRSGTIVNMSSVEGLVAIPNQFAYSASKSALECAGEALAHEVKPFGIRVVHIQPGVVRTEMYENTANAEMDHYDKESPYYAVMRRNSKMFVAGFRLGTRVERVAETVLEAIESEEYRLRWPVGQDAVGLSEGRRAMSDEEWVDMGALSDDAYERAFAQHFGIQLQLKR